MNRTIGRQASTWASFHKPVSCGEMRPCADTAVASAITAPAPPTARLPRCTMCHSFGTPSVAEYSHIGDTTRRLRSARLRWVNGSNRFIGGSGEVGLAHRDAGCQPSNQASVAPRWVNAVSCAAIQAAMRVAIGAGIFIQPK